MRACLGLVSVQKPCTLDARIEKRPVLASVVLPCGRETMLYLYKAYLYLNKPAPGRFNSPGLKKPK